MRFNVCVNEMAPFGAFLAFIKGCISFYSSVAEVEVSPQEEMVDPQGMKVFAVERHGLPEDLVYFRALCGVQLTPLVFAPNRAFRFGPLQGQAPGERLCFISALF